MIAAWMLWSIGAGLLFLAAGLAAERLFDGGRRWIWFGAAAGTVLLPVIRLLSTAGGGSGGALAGSGATLVIGGADGAAAAGSQGAGGAAGSWLDFLALTVPGDSALHALDGALLLGWFALSSCLAVLAFVGAARFLHRRGSWEAGTLLGRRVFWSVDTGPAVVGLFRPSLVLPAWVRDVEPARQKLILAHEEEHLWARDVVLRVVAAGLVVACSWNPLLWLQYRRLSQAIELDCDRRVMQRLPHRRWLYGDLLLQVVSRDSHLPGMALVALAEQPSFVERRIRKLLRKAPEVGMAQAAFLAFAAILVVAVAMSVPAITGEREAPAPAFQVEMIEIPPAAAGEVDIEPEAAPEVVVRMPLLMEYLPPPPAPEEVRESALSAKPQFVVHTARPRMTNRSEVDAVLEREYPALLKDAGIDGTVLVHLFIDETGRVGNQLVKTTSGHQALDEAALRVASVAEFTPAMNRDEPVALWIELPISFSAN